MRTDDERLFAALEAVEPRSDLFAAVMERIEQQRPLRVLYRKRAVWCFAVVASSLALLFAAVGLHMALAQSGFFELGALLLTDPAEVFTLGSAYAAVLLEALPAVNAALVFATLFAVLASIKYFSQALVRLQSSLE